jgi:hypothetical protein
MDTALLVDKKYEEGKKLLKILDEQGKRYPIAILMSEPESLGWTFLIGVPGLKSTGSRDIYESLHSILLTNNIDLSLSEISLVDTSDPVCKSLRSYIKTGKELGKTMFFGNFVNGHRFPDSIIYRVN